MGRRRLSRAARATRDCLGRHLGRLIVAQPPTTHPLTCATRTPRVSPQGTTDVDHRSLTCCIPTTRYDHTRPAHPLHARDARGVVARACGVAPVTRRTAALCHIGPSSRDSLAPAAARESARGFGMLGGCWRNRELALGEWDQRRRPHGHWCPNRRVSLGFSPSYECWPTRSLALTRRRCAAPRSARTPTATRSRAASRSGCATATYPARCCTSPAVASRSRLPLGAGRYAIRSGSSTGSSRLRTGASIGPLDSSRQTRPGQSSSWSTRSARCGYASTCGRALRVIRVRPTRATASSPDRALSGNTG